LATRAALLAGLLALAWPAAAEAKRIDVRPGPFAIQAAVDAAKPGDKLVVHRGTYREAAVIDKPLTIRGPREGRRPLINGRCQSEAMLRTLAGGVKLRRLRIRGGASFGVEFAAVGSGTARELDITDTCGALYGINVFSSGPIRVIGNRTRGGFLDAGIYVGGIDDTRGRTLVVRDNVATGNNRGLIVQETVDEGVDVRVSDNRFDANTVPGEGDPAGIFLDRADGVVLERNRAAGNGVYGVQIGNDSDRTRLFTNDFASNPTPVLDEGGETCGAGNAPNPFPPCP
jgi:nitrous oxidase accessory protein NosD